jgi:Calcineurin-like phosphoesterase
LKIAVIPDVQAKPGNDFRFLTAIGNYIVDKKPDVVVCLGDFADMPSLSSYDVGKKAFEGRRYKTDVETVHTAMETLLAPLERFNERARVQHRERYNPRRVLTLGNHENRIERAVENDAKLEGVLSTEDLKYREYGWEVYPFLDVIVINNIAFSHYFTTGVMGRPCTSAQMMLTKKHMSCIAGHQQGLQFATSYRADGHRITSIIAGSCYEHNEDYMGPQGNHHFRGIVMLNDVTTDGEFDLMPVSLAYLNKKYL